jgi:hypothetical protein
VPGTYLIMPNKMRWKILWWCLGIKFWIHYLICTCFLVRLFQLSGKIYVYKRVKYKYIHTYIRINICICIHVVDVYICVKIYCNRYIYRYLYIFIYIYVYLYTYTNPSYILISYNNLYHSSRNDVKPWHSVIVDNRSKG